MTSDLRDVVSRFMHKVEEFKVKVTRTNGRDQQKMLGSLMEVQDQLERNYISRKEEHRALEMQKHMGLCRNTGCFDPNRLVEGDIFRMGMHLEDIKEMIDRNVCEHISVCQSSSTPEVTMPQGKCGALYLESPAPPLCQNRLPSPWLPHQTHQMASQEEEDLKDPEDGGSIQSVDLMAPHSVLEGAGVQPAEDEEGDEDERSSIWTQAVDHSDIIGYVCAKPYGEQWGPDVSDHSRNEEVSPGRHMGDCEVSFALDPPRLSAPNTSSQEQRIVGLETDRGFGSSCLNRSSSGPLLRQRPESPDLHTDIPGRGGASAAARRVERRRGSELDLDAHQAAHNSTKDLGQPGSTPCPCTCEAILALQSEVAQLKKDLEEGLVQLPHLAQKMDYLTSVCRQRSTSSGLGNPANMEDWISGDTDCGWNKETSRGDTNCSEQFHSSPAGSRRCSRMDFQDELQSTRAAIRRSSLNEGRWSLTSVLTPQMPLFQVSFGSTRSLPPSYRQQESVQAEPHQRKRSTQSDTALLPTNMYFQQTWAPVSAASRNLSRTGRHGGNQEDDVIRTLDRAIQVARSMKKTTDSMARRLCANLTRAQSPRKLQCKQTQEGSRHLNTAAHSSPNSNPNSNPI